MATNIDPDILEIMEKIGEQVRELRKSSTDKPYSDFATNTPEINKNTYFRIEQGKMDYNISWMLKILKHHDIKLSQFFKDAGL